MKNIDKRCLELFPELLESYEIKALSEASDIGSYIFFEDYFNEFIEKHKNNDQVLLRAADFIESMAQTDDQDINNLAQIGILEGLVNRDVHRIAKFLKPRSKLLLTQAVSRTNIDQQLWRLGK